jgi:hypothetical protein
MKNRGVENCPDFGAWELLNYLMNGKIITNQFAGKFFTFWDALLKRKNNAAIIIIQSNNIENETMLFLKDVFPLIQNHFLSNT